MVSRDNSVLLLETLQQFVLIVRIKSFNGILFKKGIVINNINMFRKIKIAREKEREKKKKKKKKLLSTSVRYL
ncbi:hypothetical protein PUN28_013427 [Cardiocondyla obscurior]|uniref:Uncharacterized protein n=1 Tax=Cardiocondyla obscurior TaxID=286306 RepID=A0AAW2F551_9HYME